MNKFYTFLLLGLSVISCSSAIKTHPDYDILMSAVPGQSKFGNYDYNELEIVGYNIETKKYISFTNDNFEDGSPSCSPSGDKILFTSKRPITGYFSGPAPKKLFILDVSTGDLKQIQSKSLDDINNNKPMDFNHPVWSPVSNEIVFDITDHLGLSKIIIYDLDSEEIRLFMDVPDIYKIRWSSDGTLLGYEGIQTTQLSENSFSLLFELGFINLKTAKKIIFEQTDRFKWGLIGGEIGGKNFIIYDSDSLNSPINIYEYDVFKNDKKYLTSTNERHPKDCGPTADEILFVKTAENLSQDIWSLNFKTNIFKQLTFDGKSKIDIKYFNK